MTVTDLQNRVLSRLKGSAGVSYINAVNVVVDLIFKYLWGLRSELIQEVFDEYVPSGASFQELPDGFKGFVSHPYYDKTEVVELPDGMEVAFNNQTGPPEYYKIVKDKIYVYPKSDRVAHLKTFFFKQPTVLTRVSTDSLPFEGLFDDIAEEAIIKILETGKRASLLADNKFLVLLHADIDKVLAARNTPRIRRTRAKFF